jgi:hypothetical protein
MDASKASMSTKNIHTEHINQRDPPMTEQALFYSLKALQSRVQSLIEEQGEDAPCAGWIFTREDVVKYDGNGDKVQQPKEVCENVLINLQDSDFIYQEIISDLHAELEISTKGSHP